MKKSNVLSLIIFFLSALFVIAAESKEFNCYYKPVNILKLYNQQNNNLDVIHYDLKIDLNTNEKILTGIADIKFRIIKDSTCFLFVLYDNMKVSEVKLNSKPADYIHKANKVIITSSNFLDTNIISISYQGRPVKAGFDGFTFGKINGKSLVYSLSEPYYSRTWFPCNDIPSDKALASLSITNDSDKVSVSNGVLVSVTEAKGKKTYNWKTIYPISTYLMAIYSSNYENFTDHYISLDGKDTMLIDYYAIPEHFENAQKDFKEHPKMIKVLAELFGEYPFIKEKYGVAEFLWQFGAMENQTITGIGSNFVSGDGFYNDVYVHELAHHWWGNALGPATWKDIWLNEGFATYSEALYMEAAYPEDAEVLLNGIMERKFDESFTGKLYNPDSDLFSDNTYSKGAWVLHMLRFEVGDSNFFKILRTYFEKYKYKNAETKDFISICENISGKNLAKFFDQWVYSGEGIIKFIYDYKINKLPNGKSEIILNVEQVQKEYDAYEWFFNVKIADEKNVEVIKQVMNKRKQTFIIKTNLSSIKTIKIDNSKSLALNITDDGKS